MQLDNAQIYLRKDKSSGDADTAVQTGHRDTENCPGRSMLEQGAEMSSQLLNPMF